MFIEFEDLSNANLIGGCVYKGGPQGGLVGEPISKIFKLKGLNGIGNQSGIRRSMVQVKNRTNELAFMVIVNRNSEEEWKNTYNAETKILTYYGDNRTANNYYLNTKQNGNKAFEEIFSQAFSNDYRRYKLAPIFYFEKPGKSGDVRFVGLALPFVRGFTKDKCLQLKNFGEYENLVAHFTVIEDIEIEREWFYDLKNGLKINSPYQPDIWSDFLREGPQLNIEDPENKFLYSTPQEVLKHSTIREIEVRLSQASFRKSLLLRNNACQICGIANGNVLIASHIIPWRIANNEEKCDSDNGIVLCANHDRLFDRGLITFNDSGEIIISREISKSDLEKLNIYAQNPVKLTKGNREYLRYHREFIFRDNENILIK